MTLKKKLLIYLFTAGSCSAFAMQNPFLIKDKIMMAEQDEVSSTFDPFIDYGEFQDNIEEEESIIFFQKGRALTLSMMTGYEAMTLNMRQIYGDTPFMLGIGLGFFIDLRFAFQMNGVFPYGHYSSLFNDIAKFSRYGIDLKYYLTRQYLKENPQAFNAYITFGPFWMRVKRPLHRLERNPISPVLPPPQQTPQNPSQNNPTTVDPRPPSQNITNQELQAVSNYGYLGIKMGLGLEISLIKQSYMGLEVAYLFTKLPWENGDLSQFVEGLPPVSNIPHQNVMHRLQFPHRPQLSGYRFIGDMVHAVILLGINF